MRAFVSSIAAPLLAGAFFVAAAPAQSQTAEIVKRGLIDCFPAGLTTKKGKTRFCETSAVAYLEKQRRLVTAVDKSLPKKFSPVFSLAFPALDAEPTVEDYFRAKLFRKTRKIEGMAVSLDGGTVFATTAFDRIECDSAKRDRYNRLLSWPADDPGRVALVSPSERGGRESSMALRKMFAAALSVAPCPAAGHFKIEGLAVIPGHKILFGVRALGASRKKFKYVVKIVEADYTNEDGVVNIPEQTMRLYDAGTLKAPNDRPVGLSGLEYDTYNRRLYLLTSFETAQDGETEADEGIGAFLWGLTLAQYRAGAPPQPVRGRDGEQITFAHKAEGLTVIDRNHLLVIHDDDRVLGRKRIKNPRTQFRRRPHQAAFTIVRID